MFIRFSRQNRIWESLCEISTFALKVKESSIKKDNQETDSTGMICVGGEDGAFVAQR